MATQIWVTIGLGCGTVPLPEPMLTSHWWGSVAITFRNFTASAILYNEFENFTLTFTITSPRFNKLVDWLVDWWMNWLIDWAMDRLIDWLIDWLINETNINLSTVALYAAVPSQSNRLERAFPKYRHYNVHYFEACLICIDMTGICHQAGYRCLGD